MNETETVRVGIIGAGGVVRGRHIPALQRIPGVEIPLIWSRTPEKAQAVAAEFGINATADHWQEVIESPEVDAVIIATPPVLHLPATLAALSAGKHVLCQARMARNLDEARQMLSAARTSKLVTALYPARPGLKGDRVMRRLLHEEGFVGDIREVRVTGMHRPPTPQGYSWKQDPDVAGLNIMRLGMWVEVVNRWVGPAIRVMALGRTHGHQQRSEDGDMPDSLAVVAELECGAVASYHLSDCVAAGPGHSVEIYGTRGALVYQLLSDEISGTPDGMTHLQPIEIPVEEAR